MKFTQRFLRKKAGFGQQAQRYEKHTLDRAEPAVADSTEGVQFQVNEMRTHTRQALESQRARLGFISSMWKIKEAARLE